MIRVGEPITGPGGYLGRMMREHPSSFIHLCTSEKEREREIKRFKSLGWDLGETTIEPRECGALMRWLLALFGKEPLYYTFTLKYNERVLFGPHGPDYPYAHFGRRRND